MEHLSEKRLRFGEILVQYDSHWKRALLFALFFVTVLITLNFSVRFIFYLAETPRHQQLERLLVVDYIPYAEIRDSLSPLPLTVLDVSVVPGHLKSIDVVAHVLNPNPKQIAHTVDYRFVIDGVPTDTYTSYVLPGVDAYFSSFTIRGVDSSSSAKLELIDVLWRRVGQDERLLLLDEFDVSSISYKNNFDLGSFDVDAVFENRSSYSFWSMGLHVFAYRGQKIAATNFVVLDQVISGEKRSVRVSWPDTLAGVTAVTFVPVINVLDEAVFMPLAPLDPRDIDPSGLE